jgi:hypothetical protein
MEVPARILLPQAVEAVHGVVELVVVLAVAQTEYVRQRIVLEALAVDERERGIEADPADTPIKPIDVLFDGLVLRQADDVDDRAVFVLARVLERIVPDVVDCVVVDGAELPSNTSKGL